jgi:preprotein translocase subunit YajC
MAGLLIIVVTFALMWAVFIVPQQRRVRQHQALVSTLQEGDEVMTTAGIYGRITYMDDELVRLEVAPGVELRVARGAIAKRTVEPATVEQPEPLADSTLDTEDASPDASRTDD